MGTMAPSWAASSHRRSAHRVKIIVQSNGSVELQAGHQGEAGAVGDAEALIPALGEQPSGGVEGGGQHADEAGKLARAHPCAEAVRQRPAQAVADERDGLVQDLVGSDQTAAVRQDRRGHRLMLRVAAVEQRIPRAGVDEEAGHSPWSP